MYREEKVMFDQIMRGKRKEERQERRLGGHFSVFFVVLMKMIVPVILLGILLMAAGYFAHLQTKEAESELPVSKDGYYEIDSAEDFYLFWEEICADDEYARGRLMKDICLNRISDDNDWKKREDLRVYKGVEVFGGVFDGNGHTVSGLYSDKGYGLAVKNKGEIRNLLIRDSVISGWLFVGGICRGNYGVISGCTFGGKLCSATASKTLISGICSWNQGTIEQCGFSGTIEVDGEYFDGSVFGICAENQGEIVRCYNLMDLNKVTWQHWPFKYFPAITDQGEKQCFVLAASGWDFPESGQTAAIKREQAAYIPFLVRGDLYQLLVKESHKDENQELQEVLGDEVIFDLLMELIVAKGKNWDRLSLEAEVWEKSVLLTLSDGEDKVTISIYSAWPEEADWREEEDFEGLWQECAIILGEKDTESFEHSSWQIVTGQEGEETVFGSFVGFQTDKGRCGFFLQKDQRLYRIENRKNQREASEIYEILLRKLWDGRTPSLGISWNSEVIRKAALAELEASGRKKTDFGRGIWEMTPSREELYGMETLSIHGFDRISSLEDLAKMPHLKSISISGDKSSSVNFDMEKGTVSELEELWIYGVKLSDLDFLGQFPQLENLTVRYCELEDISALSSQSQLRELYLARNEIYSIEPLRYLTELQVLDLEDNQIENLEPITGLTQLYSLDIYDNPVQDIGDLIFLPELFFGKSNDEGQWQEAREILKLFYPQEDLFPDNMIKGDLNGDGIIDTVIADFYEENQKVYVFLGTVDGSLRQLKPIDMHDPGLYGMLITDGRLVVQTECSNDSGRGRRTLIYEYEEGEMREKWKTSEDFGRN